MMLEKSFLSFPESNAEILSAYPNGWTVVSGRPLVQNKRLYVDSAANRFSGIWKCTPGRFNVEYKVWEFCHLLKGQCIITHESGRVYNLSAGDSFVLEPGFRGEWNVVHDVEKHYVIQA